MESNDSPEIPDRRETSDILGLTSGELGMAVRDVQTDLMSASLSITVLD